jgi:tripartite-type tricarboxylate transporter receptor subunit TctC
VTGILKADMREYVPVAMLVEETTLVAVRADSPLKTAKDLVAALKARSPLGCKIAVAPALKGLNTHLAIAKPLKVAGVDIDEADIAPFRSSADSVSALLGGHVDVVSATAPHRRAAGGGRQGAHPGQRRAERGTGTAGRRADLARAGRGGRLRQLQRRACCRRA